MGTGQWGAMGGNGGQPDSVSEIDGGSHENHFALS